jgi:chorismate dehydratase
MMPPVRIGAVSYLNSRPLVRGLERWPDRFAVRYDLPSRCAALLAERRIDLGLVPSIEYLRGDYSVVPDIGVVSDGAVESVALFAGRPMDAVRSIALDTSSRTSVALVRVLCARRFGIRPELVPHAPDLPAMIGRADAALLIGEPALFADYERLGLTKIDLGAVWKEMTGLPFVYAFWAGHPGAIDAEGVARLQQARDEGAASVDDVARQFFPGDPARQAEGARYLGERIRYRLGAREQQGVERFLQLAVDVGVAPAARPLRFYESRTVHSVQ